jgi:hypothetical protein
MIIRRLIFSLFAVLILCGFSTCNFHEAGNLEVELYWETPNYSFGDCRYAGVDLMRYTITNHRGEIVVTSRGVVPCRDYISKYLNPGGEFTLEIEGYRYDRYEPRNYEDYFLEWETICTNIEVDGYDTFMYVCEVTRDGKSW